MGINTTKKEIFDNGEYNKNKDFIERLYKRGFIPSSIEKKDFLKNYPVFKEFIVNLEELRDQITLKKNGKRNRLFETIFNCGIINVEAKDIDNFFYKKINLKGLEEIEGIQVQKEKVNLNNEINLPFAKLNRPDIIFADYYKVLSANNPKYRGFENFYYEIINHINNGKSSELVINYKIFKKNCLKKEFEKIKKNIFFKKDKNLKILFCIEKNLFLLYHGIVFSQQLMKNYYIKIEFSKEERLENLYKIAERLEKYEVNKDFLEKSKIIFNKISDSKRVNLNFLSFLQLENIIFEKTEELEMKKELLEVEFQVEGLEKAKCLKVSGDNLNKEKMEKYYIDLQKKDNKFDERIGKIKKLFRILETEDIEREIFQEHEETLFIAYKVIYTTQINYKKRKQLRTIIDEIINENNHYEEITGWKYPEKIMEIKYRKEILALMRESLKYGQACYLDKKEEYRKCIEIEEKVLNILTLIMGLGSPREVLKELKEFFFFQLDTVDSI